MDIQPWPWKAGMKNCTERFPWNVFHVAFALPAGPWQSSQVTAAGKKIYFFSHDLQVVSNLKYLHLRICKKIRVHTHKNGRKAYIIFSYPLQFLLMPISILLKIVYFNHQSCYWFKLILNFIMHKCLSNQLAPSLEESLWFSVCRFCLSQNSTCLEQFHDLQMNFKPLSWPIDK